MSGFMAGFVVWRRSAVFHLSTWNIRNPILPACFPDSYCMSVCKTLLSSSLIPASVLVSPPHSSSKYSCTFRQTLLWNIKRLLNLNGALWITFCNYFLYGANPQRWLYSAGQALLPSKKYTETLKLARDLRMQSGRPLPQHRTHALCVGQSMHSACAFAKDAAVHGETITRTVWLYCLCSGVCVPFGPYTYRYSTFSFYDMRQWG